MNEVVKNIVIVGTSHISPQSIKEVRETILNVKPEFVALELDKGRFQSLMTDQESSVHPSLIKQVGFGGYLFLLLGRFVEKRYGNKLNIKPGVDMKSAAETARDGNAKIAMIDQDIRVTLKQVSKNFRFFSLIKTLFKSMFDKKLRKKMSIDISKVPSERMLEILVGEVKDLYPGLYKVLIEDRNRFMARKLFKLSKQYPNSKIVAVVGAGHKKEIRVLIEKYIQEN